ncbi:hypothetical protein HQ529_02555 [Candidatus Woesearchaeota archaeon]|nr:hypothetical protein [Candidatus Woesearchaeota archaeon]
MSQIQLLKKPEHSPTLRTIRMVEETIQNSDESAVPVARIKERLPKKVNHNTLMQVLDYLDESNKIVIGTKGVTWIYNPKLREILKHKPSYDHFPL